MLLFDMSNVVFSTVLEYHSRSSDKRMTEDVVRNLIMDRTETFKTKLKKYTHDGQLVFAYDSKHYWRKDVFSYYKAKRKASRDGSDFPWNEFFQHYNKIVEELKNVYPAKTIQVHGAEGDDIIAVLCRTYAAHYDICIVSSDKDLLQLQHYHPEVKQYSIALKKFIDKKDYSLFEHVVKGDVGDGVPNILSDDDTLVEEGKRQTAIRASKLEAWRSAGLDNPEEYCTSTDMLRNFSRNRTLIDLNYIPAEIVNNIRLAFDAAVIPKGKLFNYCVEHKMTRFMTGHL